MMSEMSIQPPTFPFLLPLALALSCHYKHTKQNYVHVYNASMKLCQLGILYNRLMNLILDDELENIS